MGSCNKSSQLQSYQRVSRATNTLNMSLWKVMTMSQVARQGAQAYEAQAAGRFVWGKEGFKWMSDDKSSCSQDKSSESLSSSSEQSQRNIVFKIPHVNILQQRHCLTLRRHQ